MSASESIVNSDKRSMECQNLLNALDQLVEQLDSRDFAAAARTAEFIVAETQFAFSNDLIPTQSFDVASGLRSAVPVLGTLCLMHTSHPQVAELVTSMITHYVLACRKAVADLVCVPVASSE